MKLSRREFLKTGAIAVSTAAFLPPWLEQIANAAQAATGGASDRMLVVVQMGGGNDGLNTVIPYQDGLYRDARRVIGIDGSKALPITQELALHPSMGKMQALYKAGKLAIVEGAGYPNPNRSHFRSMEIWQTANPTSIEYYGWLGRYLDADGHLKRPLTAAAIGSELPETLAAHTGVPAIGNIGQYGMLTAGVERPKALTLFRRLNGQPVRRGSSFEHVQSVNLDALESSEDLHRRVQESQAPYPESPFAAQLKEVGRILGAGVGTRIAFVRIASFDTHAGQPATQARLLGELSDGLDAFWSDITSRGLSDKVLLFTFSEFGRRVHENGSQGTDHGTAGPMFVMGGKVKGGVVYGDPPDLKNLDSNGDLRHQIDFRRVYSSVLANWLGADPDKVLGGHFDPLPLV